MWQVHLILRHKAPNGTIEEKHLKFPPSVELDKGTHVYTAVLYPSNNSCALALGWASLVFTCWTLDSGQYLETCT